MQHSIVVVLLIPTINAKGGAGRGNDFWRISINQCTGSLAGYIGEAMGGPPICPAFTIVGKSFGISAIIFYIASNANKT
jgi:hypothetical protein